MRCDEIRNLLSSYLDNDISGETKKLIDEHLAICAKCSGELQALREIVLGLKKIPEVEPPPYFLEGVHERLEESSALTKALRKIFVPVHIKLPLEAIAVTATVIIIAVLVQKGELLKLSEQKMIDANKFTTQEAPAPKRDIYRFGEIEGSASPKVPETAFWGSEYVPESGSATTTLASPELAKVATESVQRDSDMLMYDTAPAATAYKGAVSGVDMGYAQKHKAKERMSIIAEKEIILKAKSLEEDKPKLDAILKDFGATNIKVESYNDKVLFSFYILSNQLDLFLSKLKDWQALGPPSEETVSNEKTAIEPILIKLTLTTQEKP